MTRTSAFPPPNRGLDRSLAVALIVILVVVLAAGIVLMLAAYATPTDGYGMMGYYHGGGWAWMGPMAIVMMVAPLVFLIVVVYLLFQSTTPTYVYVGGDGSAGRRTP